MGYIGMNGFATIGVEAGPIPDAADISWTDAKGIAHLQHVSVAPLPAPTRTSFYASARIIAFVINADNSVTVVYHDPRFKE
jgi:hypothetical protein